MLNNPIPDCETIKTAEINLALSGFKAVEQLVNVLRESLVNLDSSLIADFKQKAQAISDFDLDIDSYTNNMTSSGDNIYSLDEAKGFAGEFKPEDLSVLFGAWLNVCHDFGTYRLKSLDSMVLPQRQLQSFYAQFGPFDRAAFEISLEVAKGTVSVQLELDRETIEFSALANLVRDSIEPSTLGKLLEDFKLNGDNLNVDSLQSSTQFMISLFPDTDSIGFKFDLDHELRNDNPLSDNFTFELESAMQSIGGTLSNRMQNLENTITEFNEFQAGTREIEDKIGFTTNLLYSIKHHELSSSCHNLGLELPTSIQTLFDVLEDIRNTMDEHIDEIFVTSKVWAIQHFEQKKVEDHLDEYIALFNHPLYEATDGLKGLFTEQREFVEEYKASIRLSTEIDHLLNNGLLSIEHASDDCGHTLTNSL
tara:strand:- start:95421 stop:96686 length:1266 start_codon:yes stop_codon:yes gene_type:complete